MRPRTVLLLVFATLAALAPLAPSAGRARQQPAAAAAQPGAGGYHALVVGNNEYRTLPKLKTAEADAREVAAILKDSYGFETTLLLNATRQQIVSALSGYRRRLGPEASLLVYYAGHGINDKDADKAYWLPVDAERDDSSNWIIADEITTALKVVPARHVLVVSDSCYSGTLTRGLGESLPPAGEREQFIQRMMAGRSRTLMASGGDEPVADGGGDGRHSVFASALMRGLRDIDKPRFTAAELFRYHVEEPVAGRAQQTPEYNPLRNSGHESGDFVFVKLRPGVAAETAAAPAPSRPAGAVDASVFELEFWNAIKESSDPEEYEDYLRRYPNGNFAELARRRAAARRGGNSTASAAPPAARPAPASRGAGTVARPAPKAGATFKNRAGVELVYVPAGSFLMGSTDAEVQRAFHTTKSYKSAAAPEWFSDELPQRRVTLADGFYMGRHEVTQAQWRAVMGNNPARFAGCDECPVENVSWNDAQVFIQRLNAQGDGFEYRLPTEAEWEYAARGGTTTSFAFGDRLTAAQANCGDSYPATAAKAPGKTVPVGSYPANGFGLYDMHGNVAEWVEDAHHDNYAGAPADGAAWVDGETAVFRVVRGGSFERDPDRCRSARRSRSRPSRPALTLGGVGFRVVAVPK